MPTNGGGRYTHERVQSPRKFARASFRTIDPGRPGHTKLIIGCPKGQWDRKRRRCRVGTQVQAILTEKNPGNPGRTNRVDAKRARKLGSRSMARRGRRRKGRMPAALARYWAKRRTRRARRRPHNPGNPHNPRRLARRKRTGGNPVARGGKLARLRGSLGNLRAQAIVRSGMMLGTLETQASAAVFSGMNGYWGDPEIPGIGAPIDLTTGLVLSGFSLFAPLKTAVHLHYLANGAVAAYTCRKSYRSGMDLRAKNLNISLIALASRRERGLNDDGTPAGGPAAAASGAVPYSIPGTGPPPGVTEAEAAAAVAAAGY